MEQPHVLQHTQLDLVTIRVVKDHVVAVHRVVVLVNLDGMIVMMIWVMVVKHLALVKNVVVILIVMQDMGAKVEVV